jgi:hypothetical protein
MIKRTVIIATAATVVVGVFVLVHMLMTRIELNSRTSTSSAKDGLPAAVATTTAASNISATLTQVPKASQSSGYQHVRFYPNRNSGVAPFVVVLYIELPADKNVPGYSVDFGDGSNADAYDCDEPAFLPGQNIGTSVTHIYTSPGMFVASLNTKRCADNSGTDVISTTSIAVTASSSSTRQRLLISPNQGQAPLTVTARFDACDAELNWGDGSPPWLSTYGMESCSDDVGLTYIKHLATSTHTYASPGIFTATLSDVYAVPETVSVTSPSPSLSQ